MVIVVNTRFLLKEAMEGYGTFTKEVFFYLASQHKEHQFYFLFDRPYDSELVFPDNVRPIVLPPPARHPLLWKYWYDWKVPAVLRRLKADVFISPDGFCSLRTKVPQCLVIHDLGFLHHPQAYKSSHIFYYKRYTPKFIRKAKTVLTVSAFSKKDIIDRYRVNPHKISVVYNGVKEVFKPLDWEKKEQVKQKYTEGKEYFLYAGAIQPRKNLISLLKAFSLFKKRQKSSMKLVLAGRMAWKNEAFSEQLKTYKYRADVVLTGYLEDEALAELMASAYAMVYPSLFEGFGIPVLESMKCDIPVLTSAGTSMEEIGEDACLYFNPDKIDDIADKLMLIYKDENLRNRLIEKGKSVAAKYSWKKTAELVWNGIQADYRQSHRQ